jgi:hypothetical protein
MGPEHLQRVALLERDERNDNVRSCVCRIDDSGSGVSFVCLLEKKKMALVTVMLSACGISLLLTVAVIVYAARVSRNEEEQICLSEFSSRVKIEQEAIAARLGRIRPVKRGLVVFAGMMTILVMVYFLINVFQQF